MVFTKFFEEASRQEQKKPKHGSESPRSSRGNPKKRRRRRKGSNLNQSSEQVERPDSTISDNEDTKKRRASSPPVKSPSKRQRAARGPPSEAALALSAKLKEYSTQKRLQDALDLYWHDSNDKVRDGHHACILVDCSARCGAIDEGEKIVNEIRRSGMHVNVETKTALLKGYAHSGVMSKGAELFKSMCLSKDERNYPNVRTLNTLLRGCLWTATTECFDGDGNRLLAGGIVTSELCWDLFRTCASKQNRSDPSMAFDCSSYEYYIAQLCYSLRVDEAKDKIDEFMRIYKISFSGDDNFKAAAVEPSVMESLAVSLMALARAMALLMLQEKATATARSAFNAADIAKRLAQDCSSDRTVGSVGGKRSWKKSDDGNGNEAAPRRSVSNFLFRSHRLSEVQSEASHLLNACSCGQTYAQPGDLAFYLMTRLMYFSGGGTTELSTAHSQDGKHRILDDPLSIRCQLLTALWHSFGLREALKHVPSLSDLVSGVPLFDKQKLCRVQEEVGVTMSSIICDDGFIDFQQVFRSQQCKEAASSETRTSHKMKRRPLDIELGSGFGDWIVDQAISNPSRDYVAVELRSDRVAQTLSKAFLNGFTKPLNNLCCVGSECGSFLRHRVRHGTVSTLFVNHPEPPTQTFGSNNSILLGIAQGGSEPAHMLNSVTLISACRCLDTESRGKLIIVTDNRWYARLVCATLVKVMKLSQGTICTSDFRSQPGIRHIETFGKARDCVFLYEGQPSQAMGHSTGKHAQTGSSYFDRLWRSGAGTHAQRKARFIISMEREQDASIASPQTHRKSFQPHAIAGKGTKGGQKNRNKKSDSKQKRRNERRLKKKSEITQD